MNISQSIKDTVKHIPHKPGVYRYYSQDDLLLYIGKAKDLKNRVSSYFQEGRPRNERLTLMISQIDRIEYTVVETEKESLILEANLINSLQPKFNILLKDDKNYCYVRITGEEFARILISRRKYDPQSDYFGPYTKKFGILQTLRTLRTIFPYCQNPKSNGKACEYVSLHQCDGVCEGKETKEDYHEKIRQIKQVLHGRLKPAEEFITRKIQESISLENYELAGLWRDRMSILEDTVSDQKIILPIPQDIDIISLVHKTDSSGLQIASCFVQNIRDGKIINVSTFILSGSEDETSPNDYIFLERFLQSYYSEGFKIDVLFQCFVQEISGETKKITSIFEHKSVFEKELGLNIIQKIKTSKNSLKIRELLELGLENALVYLERNEMGQKLNIFEENNLFSALVDIQKSIMLKKIPRRIECYDISHLSGKFVYGSMVVFVDGRPSKSAYKLFKTKEQNNDFENHKEVLERRLNRCLQWNLEKKIGKNPWQLPDLIIVDGGKGQLSADLEVVERYKKIFEENSLEFNIEICSLAKQEEEVFVPHRSDSYILSGGAHFMIQRIRDEAHRFAISNNRKARLKTATKSELDDIQGIGDVTKNKLLKTFGSKKNIISELERNRELFFELIGENLTKKLEKHFLGKI
jgi:excinuclease ABC subunit C